MCIQIKTPNNYLRKTIKIPDHIELFFIRDVKQLYGNVTLGKCWIEICYCSTRFHVTYTLYFDFFRYKARIIQIYGCVCIKILYVQTLLKQKLLQKDVVESRFLEVLLFDQVLCFPIDSYVASNTKFDFYSANLKFFPVQRL